MGWFHLRVGLSFAVAVGLVAILGHPVARLSAGGPAATLLVGLVHGVAGLAAYFAILGASMRSDPRIWRPGSAFQRRLVEAAPVPSEADRDELRGAVAPLLAAYGGAAFGLTGAMGLDRWGVVPSLALATFAAVVVGGLLLAVWR